MTSKPRYARIALPTPLRRLFDYRIADDAQIQAGCRVVVPFGKRSLTGIVMDLPQQTDMAPEKLKYVAEYLDAEPVFNAQFLQLLEKIARYYHHSLGETLFTALPSRYKNPIPLDSLDQNWITLAENADITVLKRAPRQRAIVEWLQTQPDNKSSESLLLAHFPSCKSALESLLEKKLVLTYTHTPEIQDVHFKPPPNLLNSAQQQACSTISQRLNGFGAFLLHGVTGSGKTEVYLHITSLIASSGKQTLILVPEITLTPQFIARFTHCFGDTVVTYHSALSDKLRAQNWLAFKQGIASIMIGTRSAVFAPMQRPGLIVIDEEHDASYKQQDGLKYSARDMAVMRAQIENVPAILGSATPSFESLLNARQQRYTLLSLPTRAGLARPPAIKIVDLKLYPPEEQFSVPAQSALENHLMRGEQVLIYLNRRGFSPVLICQQCGWQANCDRCDRPTTFHASRRLLNCHHCGKENRVPRQCPSCGNLNLAPLGFGTERIEKFLQHRFPDYAISRFDRDHISRKGELETQLARVHSNEARILLGTQMLTKGHDFPNVTMVLILDADQGLFGADLRAAERFIQMITQVSGRAGRADKPGTVYIQTRHADHPLITGLLTSGYLQQADELLTERKQAHMPPFVFAASIRAEANHEGPCYDFLQQVFGIVHGCNPGIELLGPAPAIMPRKAGRYRVQLLLLADNRQQLHQTINQSLDAIEKLPEGRKVRWALEVDPVELA